MYNTCFIVCSLILDKKRNSNGKVFIFAKLHQVTEHKRFFGYPKYNVRYEHLETMASN